MNVCEMLARNARMFPDRVALIERTPSLNLRTSITWAQFDEKTDRMAAHLESRGIGKNDKVMHWMRNSIEWLVAYLAILKTGAWAVPLNFRFTEEDFRYCAEIAEPKAVILDEEFFQKVKVMDHRLWSLEEVIVFGNTKETKGGTSFQDILSISPPRALRVEIPDEDPCALYFTSGTTGLPKPILLTHKNLECAAITEVVHGLRKSDDIFVVLKPLYHTGDKIHWLASLILGATAVIQKEKITPEAIFRVMHEEKGSVAMLLVPWIQDILTALDTGELKKEEYDLQCWRLVMLGAQPVPPNLVRQWKELFPHIQYEVNYGLTESSGPGCIHLGIDNDKKLGSLGMAGFNWEAQIVNEEGTRVSAGAVGEILVRGNGVMKEYYRNPERTAETLRDGWLYTGDMGRFDEDGYIWLVDRKKEIVIYGGENIYPSEIEEVFQTHPYIHDVGVLGVPDQRLGEVVAAVIELEPNAPPEAEAEIGAFCQEKLPRYKRPHQMVFDKVFRSPTGKIEKLRMKRAYFLES
jgi:acyl-CoA synthetase (AMP-forming)/AMP-acid ligase II